MEIIKQYDMSKEEDREAFKLDNKAVEMYSALFEIQGYLRARDKYDEYRTVEAAEAVHKIRTNINQTIGDLLDD